MAPYRRQAIIWTNDDLIYWCTRPQWVNNSSSNGLVSSGYKPGLAEQSWWNFNINMPPKQYRKSHFGDKIILPLSYLHNGISICIRQHLYIEWRPRHQGVHTGHSTLARLHCWFSCNFEITSGCVCPKMTSCELCIDWLTICYDMHGDNFFIHNLIHIKTMI